MTQQFSKWSKKQEFAENELSSSLREMSKGSFEANLGGHLYKKRVAFKGRGKSGSARTIICFKKGDRAIFIHGFSKNEKSNLSSKELTALTALTELANILLSFPLAKLETAIANGNFIEVGI